MGCAWVHGTALGVVFNHTILGLAIGLGVGMFVGSLFTNKHDDNKSSKRNKIPVYIACSFSLNVPLACRNHSFNSYNDANTSEYFDIRWGAQKISL